MFNEICWGRCILVCWLSWVIVTTARQQGKVWAKARSGPKGLLFPIWVVGPNLLCCAHPNGRTAIQITHRHRQMRFISMKRVFRHPIWLKPSPFSLCLSRLHLSGTLTGVRRREMILTRLLNHSPSPYTRQVHRRV